MIPDFEGSFLAAKYRRGLVTIPIFTISIPIDWSSFERRFNIFSPDKRPSLPRASSSIFSSLHF